MLRKTHYLKTCYISNPRSLQMFMQTSEFKHSVLTLNLPTILSSSNTFWSSSSPPFPRNRLKLCSQSSKFSNSLSSSFGYTLFENTVMMRNYHLQVTLQTCTTLSCIVAAAPSTFSSSSFGFLLSNASIDFFLSFFPFPRLVPFTGKSSGLISEYRLALRTEWREGERGDEGAEHSRHEFHMKVARNQLLVPTGSMPLNCILLKYTVQWEYLAAWEDPPGMQLCSLCLINLTGSCHYHSQVIVTS